MSCQGQPTSPSSRDRKWGERVDTNELAHGEPAARMPGRHPEFRFCRPPQRQYPIVLSTPKYERSCAPRDSRPATKRRCNTLAPKFASIHQGRTVYGSPRHSIFDKDRGAGIAAESAVPLVQRGVQPCIPGMMLTPVQMREPSYVRRAISSKLSVSAKRRMCYPSSEFSDTLGLRGGTGKK